MRFAAPMLGLLLLSACGHRAERTVLAPVSATTSPTPTPAPSPANWRTLATSGDRARLRDWRNAWMAALPQARAADAAGLGAQGALFTPDLALADAAPPPGSYRCRVFKLGAKGAAMRGFTAYPAFACRIAADEDGTLGFTKLTGSQRPIGRILPDGPSRAVFLGTLVLGDERRPLSYGTDVERDVAGWVERIGPARWRLVMPYPHFESLLDVIELVPADS